MATQVYTGSGNFSYTNTTGQNVRVILNYVEAAACSVINVTANSISFGIRTGDASVSLAFGKNFSAGRFTSSGGFINTGGGITYSTSDAINNGVVVTNSLSALGGSSGTVSTDIESFCVPNEIYLANNQTITLTATATSLKYNIMVITES